jgi:hypothetical protein
MKRIRKNMPFIQLSYLGGTNWSNVGGRENYTQVVHTGSGAAPAFYYQDTIDISGVTSVMEEALVPANIEIHQNPVYRAGGTAATEPDNYMVEWLMITTVPFDVNAWVSGFTIAALQQRLPTVGGESDPATVEALSADQCMFGRCRYLQNDIETFERVAVVKGENFFGSLSPTMTDELYCTRLVYWVGTLNVGARIELPELQFNIDAYTGELSELEQIMELRRSYLTQQTIA